MPELSEDTARFLMTPDGRKLLAQADGLRDGGADTLAALTRLRRSADPDRAAAAWELSDLRRRGEAKFGPHAAQMYFTREALEQASGARAADYHARRFADAGLASVADLGGGIGGDALAFARRGLRVTLYETDPVRALFGEENARVHGLQDALTVVQADFTTVPTDAQAAWFDPARRRDKRRIADPDDYAPPLSFLNTLEARGLEHVGVKVAPAVEHAVAAQYGAELEFLSDHGECKEGLLWRGALRAGASLRATRLTPDGPLSLTGTPDDERLAAVGTGCFLYEPDPAVIRAHLVQTLGRALDAAPVAPQVAYLLGRERVATPWAVGYEVFDDFPYSRRRLENALKANGVGRVVIKKRGFPQEPDDVRRSLKLTGAAEMTVILTRRGADHHAFLCRPLPRETDVSAPGRSSSR